MSGNYGQLGPDLENGGGNGGDGRRTSLIFVDKCEKLYQEIKYNNVEEVAKIMAPMPRAEQIPFLTLKTHIQPVLLAIECGSMDCLRYLLKRHQMYAHALKNYKGIDQADGFTNNDLQKNAYHYIAVRDRKVGHDAADILNEFSDILECIVNKPDKNGVTPLLTAVKRKNTTAAKLLVQIIGPGFEEIIKGQSPIHIAVTNGQVEVLEEMIKVTEKDLFVNDNFFGKGHTIFYPAAASGSDDMFIFLFDKMGEKLAWEHLKTEMRHKDRNTFIKCISSSDMPRAMEKLMEFPLDEEQRSNKDKETIKKIDKKSAAEEVKSATPLMWAAKHSRLETVKLILKKSGKQVVNMVDGSGKNVFHYAAEAEKPDVLNYLIPKSKSEEKTVDTDDERGETDVSHYAAEEKEPDDQNLHLVEDQYLQLCNKKDYRGCSPLHYAAVADLFENVKLLVKDNIKMSNDSIFHCTSCVKKISSDPELLEFILEKYKESQDIDLHLFFESENKQKRTPLQEAAYAGRTDILKLLLKYGASIKLRSTYFYWTALHFAVAGRSLPTVQLVVAKSKDLIELKSDDDETPAVIAAESGNAQILKFLLEKGATVCGEYPKENLLDCVTQYSKHIPNRVETALVIIRFCDQPNKGINLLKKLMKDSASGPEGIMSKLVKRMPSVAIEILNTCAQTIKFVDLENTYTHEYHFFPLKSEAKEVRGGKDLKAIGNMVRYKRYDCLGHPVVKTFLNEKWIKSTARLWYMGNNILYVMFLLSMTTYMCLQAKGSHKLTSPMMVGLSMLSFVIVLFNVLNGISQTIFASWKGYFLDPNYLQWAMYVSALIYLSPSSGEEKTVGQIQAGAIAVLLAWINFLWFFKSLSVLGIYIIMAQKIFISLLKILPMVILYIFAFSMAFFLLMGKDIGFHNFPISLLTTSVMMVGEVNYREVFLDKEKGPYIVLQRIILICFLMLMTIVLMNLLVGLAVGVTSDTIKRSKDEKRFYKASLIIYLQHSLAHQFGIGLSDIKESKTVNEKVEKKRQPWYITLWEKVYQGYELDDDDDNEIILSRLRSVESSIVRLTKELEKNGNKSIKTKSESDEKEFDDAE